MTTPQPVNGLPSRPGIWSSPGVDARSVEMLDGIAIIFVSGDIWRTAIKSEGPFQWVRDFRDGDPRIHRPTKPAPPLPDAEHRHPDGCPKDGLWVFRECGLFYLVNVTDEGTRGISFHHPHADEYYKPEVHRNSFLRYVGHPSDFAPAEPPPPAIEQGDGAEQRSGWCQVGSGSTCSPRSAAMTPGYYWFLTKLNGWQPVSIDDVGLIRMIGAQHAVADATGKHSDIAHRIGPRIETPPELRCSRCHGTGKEPSHDSTD